MFVLNCDVVVAPAVFHEKPKLVAEPLVNAGIGLLYALDDIPE
jgi:hypothetical protein